MSKCAYSEGEMKIPLQMLGKFFFFFAYYLHLYCEIKFICLNVLIVKEKWKFPYKCWVNLFIRIFFVYYLHLYLFFRTLIRGCDHSNSMHPHSHCSTERCQWLSSKGCCCYYTDSINIRRRNCHGYTGKEWIFTRSSCLREIAVLIIFMHTFKHCCLWHVVCKDGTKNTNTFIWNGVEIDY